MGSDYNWESMAEECGGVLIRFRADYLIFNTLELDVKTITFLKKVGLPLLGANLPVTFIPLTFFPSISIKDDLFVLIGDVYLKSPGVSFAGIKVSTNQIFRLTKESNGGWESRFLNSDVACFCKFMLLYCAFQNKYWRIGYQNIVANDFKNTYDSLVKKFNLLDPQAMHKEGYWKRRIVSLEGIYGDFIP